MPKDDQIPHTQTSAPVEPPETTTDPVKRGTPDEDERRRREAGRQGVEPEHMPKGADEPGAGL